MTAILKNDKHALIIERIKSDTWLELVNRESGHVQILTFKSKGKAMKFIKNVPLEKLVDIYNKMKIEIVPMYKKGVI